MQRLVNTWVPTATTSANWSVMHPSSRSPGAPRVTRRALLHQRPTPHLPHPFPRPRPQRRFRLLPRKGVADSLTPTWNDPKTPGVLRLRDGCLVVMGGACQQTHKHELMKVTKQPSESVGRRINLTLRAFAAPGRHAAAAAGAHVEAVRKRPRDLAGDSEVTPRRDDPGARRALSA